MNSSAKILLALCFAILLVYFLTSTSILQRYSYDIYECTNRVHGSIKMWFKNLVAGETFELTTASESRLIQILGIADNKVVFFDNGITYKLDLNSQRLIADDKGSISFFGCELKQFTM